MLAPSSRAAYSAKDATREAPLLGASVSAAGMRRFPQRIMRHTAASWLVQHGVPLMRITPRRGGTRT
jgi:hypothetical protein